VQGLAFALGAGLGLTLALTLMGSIRERVELSDSPLFARSMGIVLVIAACMSMAFMGFGGLFAS
jgi:Na+-translocating ferredoxin:NAD+ oxidoreductase RnfA subunit